MKKTPLKRKAKTDHRKTEDALWQECRRLIFSKYGDICFTCGKPISGSNRHCAHFIPKAACGAYLKYDLRNLRPGCYYCNINLGGNGAVYYRKLLETEGQEYIDSLFKDKQISVKSTDHYLTLLEKYRMM
jgi:hypothetical protein